jgi:hypothetical protein
VIETVVIETSVIETPAGADAGGEVCPGATAIPAHVLPEETGRRPASGVPVQAESILGVTGTGVSGPGSAAVGTTPDGVVPERQLGAQAALRSHDRADVPAPRVGEGPVLRQDSPLWLRVEAPADRAALATEGVAGQNRDPALSVPAEGRATPVIAATQPWTGPMPARPLARAETEMVIAQARETADFWAAPPGFSLPELAQAQLPVAGGVRPVLVSPEGLCRQVGEAALKMQDDRIEIALSPEELGSVRLVLSRGEAGAAMTVWVERPEVLEMLRRNVDVLTADLQKSGLGDATLAFQDGSGDQGRSPAGHAPDGPVARGDFRRDGADDGARTAGNGPRSRPHWTGAEGLRLDIRV